MFKPRNLLILALLVLAAAVAFWIYWRFQLPPRVARVLPDGDRLLYIDARPVQLLNWNDSKPLQLEGSYQQFVDQTGIHFEHDLDQAAVVWRLTDNGLDSESAAVFAGRFDPARLQAYLKTLSTQTDNYKNRAIYSIPHDNHIVRVALIDDHTVAVTNMNQPGVMQELIERWEHAAQSPSLLAQYYRIVPTGSMAWFIDHFPEGSIGNQLPDGLSFSFLENTVAVVSARYNGNLLLRGDVVTAGEPEARRLIDSASGFLSLYRGISRTVSRGGDKDVKAALDSIRVEQKGRTAMFSATLTQNFLKKMVQEVGPQVLPTPSPEVTATPEPKRPARHARTTSRRSPSSADSK